MQMLTPGTIIQTGHSGVSGRILRLLGSGGQGAVYSVDLGGEEMALKWYSPECASPQQWTALERIISTGPPTERFLWPIELARCTGLSEFGYIMRLRPSQYGGLSRFMRDKVRMTFRNLATAGHLLADSFLQLHAKGLCYCDISFGNVFFHPNTGEVLICDNDNVAVNRSIVDGIKGTPRFMAPEIVRGEASPSTQTDLFSLAVLLFCMFMKNHPLEGRKESAIHCMDEPAQRKIYGLDPVFIFDPVDESNRPDPEWHQVAIDRWQMMPQFLRQLFVRAFTDGIRDPEHGRVRESEWRQAFVRLRDAIVHGPDGAENFYCDDYRKAHNGELRACWHSGQAIPVPYRITIGRQLIVLNADARLFPHHVDDRAMWNFREPVAEVARHPTQPGVWGLKNLTPRPWLAKMRSGETKEVAPGRSISLGDGTEIDFGTARGIIQR